MIHVLLNGLVAFSSETISDLMNLIAASHLKANRRTAQNLVRNLCLLGLVLGQKHDPYQGKVFCSLFGLQKRLILCFSFLLSVGRQSCNVQLQMT